MKVLYISMLSAISLVESRQAMGGNGRISRGMESNNSTISEHAKVASEFALHCLISTKKSINLSRLGLSLVGYQDPQITRLDLLCPQTS